MIQEKPWYLSKTVWGAAVSVAATIGSLLGLPIDPSSQAALTDAILQLIAAISGVFAIFGRVSATERLT